MILPNYIYHGYLYPTELYLCWMYKTEFIWMCEMCPDDPYQTMHGVDIVWDQQLVPKAIVQQVFDAGDALGVGRHVDTRLQLVVRCLNPKQVVLTVGTQGGKLN